MCRSEAEATQTGPNDEIWSNFEEQNKIVLNYRLYSKTNIYTYVRKVTEYSNKWGGIDKSPNRFLNNLCNYSDLRRVET